MRIESFACTHTGRRSNNEDAHCAEPRLGLFAVADGMGGYEGGEIASQLVIGTLTDFFRRNAQDQDLTWPFGLERGLSLSENMVSVAVKLANSEVCARKTGKLASMGSTVAALIVRDGHAVIGHVGDSRVYRLRAGELSQLTRDHSLYAEMEAARVHDLPPRDKCPFINVITRAVGMPNAAVPDLRSEALREGDVYLLCTDGLTETVPPERMAEALETLPPREACATLVNEAYERGGRDNITAVVVRVVPSGAEKEAREAA